MAKKSQTTGVPKAKPKNEAAPQENKGRFSLAYREYRSRAEREAAIQRWILLGTGIVVAVIVLVIVIALVIDRVIIPGQVVATVNGENITVADFEHRVRLERVMNNERVNNLISAYLSAGGSLDQAGQLLQREPYKTWWDEINLPDQMGLRVLNDMIDDRIVVSKAAEMGITVTDEDIQTQINNFFGYDPEAVAALGQEPTPTVEPTITPTPYVSPTPSPTPTITPTPETEPTATITPFPTIPPSPTASAEEIEDRFDTLVTSFYRNARIDASITEDDFKEYFRVRALRAALEDAVTPEIASPTLYMDGRHILVDTEEEAQDILAALQAGGSFADLARAASIDTGSGQRGGELGWSPIILFVEPFADAVREAPINEIIGPVQTEFGYHIIQVRAREEREIEQAQLDGAKARAFDTWLEDLKTSDQTVYEIYPLWASYVPEDPAFILRQQ